jgi:hypothetical protein
MDAAYFPLSAARPMPLDSPQRMPRFEGHARLIQHRSDLAEAPPVRLLTSHLRERGLLVRLRDQVSALSRKTVPGWAIDLLHGFLFPRNVGPLLVLPGVQVGQEGDEYASFETPGLKGVAGPHVHEMESNPGVIPLL